MLKVSSEVRSTQTQDGSILLNIHHGEMFCLNLVGSKILELLQLGYDEPRIAAQISAEYSVSQDVVASDVRDFIESLHKHHIFQPI
jgi:Coenzyme PQQ synthesis protein D (PqqD)